MDLVFQYRIPVLHPLAVHFPTALLLTAGLVGLVWMVRGTSFWRRTLLLLLVLGTAGTAFAYFTGEALEEHVEGSPIVSELVGLHEQMALYTFIGAGGALLLLLALVVYVERRTTIERDPPDPLWPRLLIGLMVLAAAALVAYTAHIGGTMVWGVAR